MTRVSELPTRGTLGMSVQAFLAGLASQRVSGTFYLNHAGAATLMTLRDGEPHMRTDFGVTEGAALDLSAVGAEFGFWPYAATLDVPLPTLPSRYPGLSGPLWALPALSEHTLLSTAETELHRLVARLRADAFTGALVLEAPDAATPGYGLLVFQGGGLGGAVCEVGAQLQSGGAALRALVEMSAALTLHALPEPVVAGFLGWLLGLQLSDVSSGHGVPEGFSGLELTPAGVRYYRTGNAYLQLPRPPGVLAEPTTLGLFAACQRAPGLSLPGEPRSWETRRYGLTLRGRDALNSLTELAMRFSSDFGPSGRRTLEAFRHELSAGAAAEALNLEPGDLKGVIERLERGGFIRTVSEPLGDVSPTPYLQPR